MQRMYLRKWRSAFIYMTCYETVMLLLKCRIEKQREKGRENPDV